MPNNLPLPGQENMERDISQIPPIAGAQEKARAALMPFFQGMQINPQPTKMALPVHPDSTSMLYESVHPNTFAKTLEFIQNLVMGKWPIPRQYGGESEPSHAYTVAEGGRPEIVTAPGYYLPITKGRVIPMQEGERVLPAQESPQEYKPISPALAPSHRPTGAIPPRLPSIEYSPRTESWYDQRKVPLSSPYAPLRAIPMEFGGEVSPYDQPLTGLTGDLPYKPQPSQIPTYPRQDGGGVRSIFEATEPLEHEPPPLPSPARRWEERERMEEALPRRPTIEAGAAVRRMIRPEYHERLGITPRETRVAPKRTPDLYPIISERGVGEFDPYARGITSEPTLPPTPTGLESWGITREGLPTGETRYTLPGTEGTMALPKGWKTPTREEAMETLRPGIERGQREREAYARDMLPEGTYYEAHPEERYMELLREATEPRPLTGMAEYEASARRRRGQPQLQRIPFDYRGLEYVPESPASRLKSAQAGYYEQLPEERRAEHEMHWNTYLQGIREKQEERRTEALEKGKEREADREAKLYDRILTGNTYIDPFTQEKTYNWDNIRTALEHAVKSKRLPEEYLEGLPAERTIRMYRKGVSYNIPRRMMEQAKKEGFTEKR